MEVELEAGAGQIVPDLKTETENSDVKMEEDASATSAYPGQEEERKGGENQDAVTVLPMEVDEMAVEPKAKGAGEEETQAHLSEESPEESTPERKTEAKGNNALTQRNSNTPALNPFAVGPSPKKSNLRKTSKYERLAAVEFPTIAFGCSPCKTGRPVKRECDEDSTPKKRIRIVIDEEGEEVATTESEPLDKAGSGDLSSGIGMTYQTNVNEEAMLWVCPPSAALDFSLINGERVRTKRAEVPKQFNFEVDLHFMDNTAVDFIFESKTLVHSVGYFNFEKVCQLKYPPSQKYVYPVNAENLRCLDESVGNLIGAQNDGDTGVFYFADMWTKSKGFREHILTRSQQFVRNGVLTKGFTIHDIDGNKCWDFSNKCGILFSTAKTKPIDFSDEELSKRSLPVELVEPLKINGHKGLSFNICDISVSDEFVRNILAKTDNKGVHLLVADNPECLNVPEFVREIRMQRKFYAQCIIALLTVREGGSFVVKICSLIKLFSAGLVFLLHRCFQNVSIHKPSASPAHSTERFLVCTGKLKSETSDDILQFLLTCHPEVMQNSQVRAALRSRAGRKRRMELISFEVQELVPVKVIANHSDFFEYLRLQNILHAKTVLRGIQQVCESASLYNWSSRRTISFNALQKHDALSAQDIEKLGTVVQQRYGLTHVGVEHPTTETLKKVQNDRENWVAYPVQDHLKIVGGHPLSLFMGSGGDKVFYLDKGEFKPVFVEGLTMTKGTLLLAKIVGLLPRSRDSRNETSHDCEFHILDGISLHGEYIGDLPFETRLKLLENYAAEMTKIKDIEYLKCSVIRVAKPVVLKQNSLSSWISSCVSATQDPYQSTKILKAFEFPEAGSKISITVDGFFFYNTTGTVVENIKEAFFWNWEDGQMLSGGAVSVPAIFTQLEI